MRESDPPICYLVGTPKGRLSKLEAELLQQPWKDVRPGLEVKLLAQEKELYILAQSRQRLSKERAIRRRRLKKLWQRLAQLRQMRLSRDQLLIKLGQAKEEAGRMVWKLVQIHVAQADNSLCRLCLGLRLRAVRATTELCWLGAEQRARVLRQLYGQQLKVSSRSARSNGFWIPRACISAVLFIPTCFW